MRQLKQLAEENQRLKRLVAVERRAGPKVSGPNQVWSLDLVSDPLADGRRFRALRVVDVYTRESLAIEAWRREYNESRPHRALWERTQHEFAFRIAASCDPKDMQSPQDSP